MKEKSKRPREITGGCEGENGMSMMKRYGESGYRKNEVEDRARPYINPLITQFACR